MTGDNYKMTNFIEIVPSKIQHVRELGRSMRTKDAAEAIAMGLKSPERGLFNAYKFAVIRNTCIVGSEVAAMWGVCGVPLSEIGAPYLVTGKAVEHIHPIKFARIYIEQVKEMLAVFPVLENYVDDTYEESKRMLKIAGFKLSEPEPIGPYNRLFRRFRITEEDI